MANIIRWRGCVAKRRGQYVLDFDDQHGRRRWEQTGLEVTEANKPKADQLLMRRRVEVEDGTYASKREQQVRTVVRPTTKFEELIQHFLDNLRVRSFTKADYESLIRTHILPEFGDKRLSEITNQVIMEFSTRLCRKRVKGTNRPLSKTRVNMVLTRLKQIFNHASDLGWIENLPRIKNVPNDEKQERGAYTYEECEKLFAAAAERRNGERNSLLFKFALLTGMREGEILGLEWRDIRDGWAYPTHTARQGKKNTPKNKSSKQPVRLPDGLLDLLDDWRPNCPKPPPGADHGHLVFPTTKGTREHVRNLLRRDFYPALDAIGITKQVRDERNLDFHSIRHTMPSLLAEVGVDQKSVQRRMRHSSIEMTMNVYTHARRDSEDVCAAALDRMFPRSSSVAGSTRSAPGRLLTHDSESAEVGLEAVGEASEVL